MNSLSVHKNIIYLFIRVFIGIIFIFSAVSKLISMDSFEIYLYGFGIFQLDTAFFISRLLISFEILLGLLFILGLELRKTIFVTLITLILFTLFILYLLVVGRDEDCHCFGEIIKFSHTESIIKNIALIFLSLTLLNAKNFIKKYKILIFSIFLVISILTPFFYSPPDTFFQEEYSKKTNYDEESLNKLLNEIQLPNKSMLCFYGAKCRFCKLSAKKTAVVAQKLDLDSNILHIFVGNKEEIDSFYIATNTPKYRHISLEIMNFLKISKGNMPLILIIENKKVIKKYGYRDFNEKEVKEFFDNN